MTDLRYRVLLPTPAILLDHNHESLRKLSLRTAQPSTIPSFFSCIGATGGSVGTAVCVCQGS